MFCFFIQFVFLIKNEAIIGQHDRFNGYEFEQTAGNSEGQGSLLSIAL